MEPSVLTTLLEISVALIWVAVLLFVFSSRFVPKSKKKEYCSRKLRFGIVVFAIATGFYSVGKIDSFSVYKDLVVMILLIVSGANVADKFAQKRNNTTVQNK